MEVGYNLQLNFVEHNHPSPFGIEFLNDLQPIMIRAIENEYANLANTNINLDTNEGQTQLSTRATQLFKERVRLLLERFLTNVDFNVSVNVMDTESTTRVVRLTAQEYTDSIKKYKGSQRVLNDLGLPTDNNPTCPICLESLLYKRIWHGTRCGHLFHPRCLQHYLTKKCVQPKCPVCREMIAEPPSDPTDNPTE